MLKRKHLLVLGLMIAGAALVIFSMFELVGPLLSKDTSSSTTQCSQTKTIHIATIQNNKIIPEHIYAKKCDTLMIVNNDSVTRLMAFGQHENHIPYNGVSETRLEPGDHMNVTLNQIGTYLIHDHYDESVSADFTVN